MVNTAALQELITVIETEKFPFDMGEATTAACGTPGCIGGTAAAIWPEICVGNPYNFWNADMLEEKLGITAIEHEDICFPKDSVLKFSDTDMLIEYEALTRKGAVAMLKRFAATGKVEWIKSEQV